MSPHYCIQVRENEVLTALTTRTIFTRGETVSTTLAATASTDVRDAFVKGIYGRMFIGIVNRINVAIYRPVSKGADRRTSIGVLDIFGFEDFTKNRQVSHHSILSALLFTQVQASNDASLLCHKLFSFYVHTPHRCSSSSLSS